MKKNTLYIEQVVPSRNPKYSALLFVAIASICANFGFVSASAVAALLLKLRLCCHVLQNVADLGDVSVKKM